MMGLMVIHGAQAGGFSPISVYGGIVNGLMAKALIGPAPMQIFAASLFFNLAIAAGLFVGFGGLRLGARAAPLLPEPTTVISRMNLHRALTLAGLLLLGVGALVFKLNVGLLAVVLAVALSLLAPTFQKGAIDKVSWSTVLLICGVITYVEIMQKAGAVDQVGAAISGLDSPLVAALLLCFTGAIVSAFASSTALLGAVIPLAIPFLAQGRISTVGVIAAIAVCTTIVDTSPFSTNGALVVANASEAERDRVMRGLLLYSAGIVALGPVVAWLVLIVPGWL